MSYRNWVVSNLKKDEMYKKIESVTALGENLIEIVTRDGKIVIVGVIDSNENITRQAIYKIYINAPKTPNIIVARTNLIWEGNAIEYCRQHNMGWGRMSEIYQTFDTNHYEHIQRREYKFVENGLSRHSRVERLERIYDRFFKIHRTGGLPPFTITLIDSYELSGDEVRHAIDVYGKFNAVLKTNPNGHPTGYAISAAGEIGAEILEWGELLGRLNKR